MKSQIAGSLFLVLGLSFGAAFGASPVTVAPYGTWASPVTPLMVAGTGGEMTDVTVDGNVVYWVEGRPGEGGRNAIMKFNGGKAADVTPKAYDARTEVQEYGGGNLLVSGGAVFFPNFADQRLYRQNPGAAPVAITPDTPQKPRALRYADCALDHARLRLICVAEDHRGAGQAKNTLVAIAADGAGVPLTLFEGTDFAAAPRLDPKGEKLAWLSWNHPDMPWDETTLWLADIGKDGKLTRKLAVASGASIGEPQWGPDGKLYFVSDQTGWWNIYALDQGKVKAVHPMAAEFSEPAWQFNYSSYVLVNAHTIVASVTGNARAALLKIDLDTGKATTLETPFVAFHYLRRLNDQTVVFVGDESDRFSRLVRLDVTHGGVTTLRGGGALPVPAGTISKARDLTFWPVAGEASHAFYYPPQNPAFAGPKGALPPLIVMAHGGPTSMAKPALSFAVQFWTSRGYAFLDVNYRGSSGFGRAYRNKLKGQWGVVDIEDVVKGARYAAAKGLADPKRLITRGGSAGGYVVLAALSFHDVFAVGASYYGISDLSVLAQHTHKFESRYMDGLVGPYPAAKNIYKARSPIYHLEGFKKPLILFQGLADEVVPPEQSEAIAKALKKKGLPVEFYTYPGEGHGFRMSANIIDALEKEQAFYRKVLELK
jgi:dipeptidyl aminopeptidase/acylaminoacyl peptidase